MPTEPLPCLLILLVIRSCSPHKHVLLSVWQREGSHSCTNLVGTSLSRPCVLTAPQAFPVQAARTTFVSPSDPTVVLALDTNIQMIKELPFEVVVSDRCRSACNDGLCAQATNIAAPHLSI